ncbi:MAG: hypothetical protein OEV92_01390 [Nitrospinota bacterium]|nr:hypothetical protein [Nitrospinota bacterium]
MMKGETGYLCYTASKGYVPHDLIKAGVTYRIIFDHFGSVRLVVNASNGSVVQRIDYDHFKNVIAEDESACGK